ncbi:MFS transporter [Chloroflexota bacterium]
MISAKADVSRQKNRKRPKIFYGWWIVAVSLVILFITIGLTVYTFGVFFQPLIAEFGWGRATFSGAMSIFMLAWGFACPFAGRLTDRYGPPKPIVWGTVALGASFCLLSLTGALWQLYLLYACAGVAAAICSEIPTNTAITNWFQKKRGMAMGIAAAGMGFGGLVLAPAAGQFITDFGWQATFLVMGLLTWVIIIPLAAFIMKARPQEMGLLPDGEASHENESLPGTKNSPARQNSATAKLPAAAINKKELWLVGFAFSAVSFGIVSVTTHEVPFIIDLGVPLGMAATALGLTAGIGILGKLGLGYLADRHSPRWVMLAFIALQAVGVVILMQSKTLGMVWVFVAVYAFAAGGMNTLRPLVIGECFGTDSFGKTFGAAELIRRLGAAAGPLVTGYIFDLTGSYHYAFIIIVVAYLAAMVLISRVHPVIEKA